MSAIDARAVDHLLCVLCCISLYLSQFVDHRFTLRLFTCMSAIDRSLVVLYATHNLLLDHGSILRFIYVSADNTCMLSWHFAIDSRALRILLGSNLTVLIYWSRLYITFIRNHVSADHENFRSMAGRVQARVRALYRQCLRTVQRLPVDTYIRKQHRQNVQTIFRVYKLETKEKKIEQILQRGIAHWLQMNIRMLLSISRA